MANTYDADTALAAMEIVADGGIKGYRWERETLANMSDNDGAACTRSGYLMTGHGVIKEWQRKRLVGLGLVEKTSGVEYDETWPAQSRFDAPIKSHGRYGLTALGFAVAACLGC
jgi:hypothetical protein